MINLSEWSDKFDVYYNNITSNQAAGLNEYEKSVFLTKAQDEIVKNYFTAKSKGNTTGMGFDDSAKRQADFSSIMKTAVCNTTVNECSINPNSVSYEMPSDLYIAINEVLQTDDGRQLQVLPLRYDEYTRLMSKPFKRPLKNQAWRITSNGSTDSKVVEIVTNMGDIIKTYTIRYVRMLKPIILVSLEGEGLSIKGMTEAMNSELDESLHEDTLQRAVELAKAAWVTSQANDNMQVITQMGERSE